MRIDLWTLVLQTVNVLVLLWLLQRFLFRPVAAVINARRDAADKLLAEAEARRAQADADAEAAGHQREALEGEREHLLAEARAAAEAERSIMLRQAAEAATRLQAEAGEAIVRDRSTMRRALEQEAGALAVTIALRLLQRVPARTLNRAFLDALADTLAEHPARTSLAGIELEVSAAFPLDAEAQADCRVRLGRVLGEAPHLRFRTDPALIAGLELAAPHLVVRNSWRADLDRIARDLHEAANDVLAQPVA